LDVYQFYQKVDSEKTQLALHTDLIILDIKRQLMINIQNIILPNFEKILNSFSENINRIENILANWSKIYFDKNSL